MPLFREACVENHSDKYGKNQKKYCNMPVQELSDIQDHKGKTGHTASKLDKYLIEDRHHFHDQEQDDEQHHDDHDQRISNRTLDGFCQRILFLTL